MKQVKRYDFGELKNAQKTPQGFLRVPGFATRCGVFTYRDAQGNLRRELRHPDEVFHPDSLATLRNAPVTLKHPKEMVNPENIGKYLKGYVGDRVEVVQDKVDCDLIITHKDAIEAIENGGVRELSSGYLADLLEESGVYNGTPYDYRQKNIVYNHLAAVDKGRAGPEVRLRLDSADAIMEPLTQEEKTMQKLMIGGKDVEMPEESAAIVKDMMDRYDQMKAKLDELQAGGEKKDMEVNQQGVSPKPAEQQMAPDGTDAMKKTTSADMEGAEKAAGMKDAEGGVAMSPVEELKKQLSEMMAQRDALQAKCDEMSNSSENKKMKMDSDEFRTAVAGRVKLERKAAALLPAEKVQKFDSMSDDEIRKAVISHRHPNADLAGKSTIYLETRFDSITESVELSDKRHREMGSSFLKRMDAEEASPGDARKRAVQESKDAWKQPLTAVRN